MEFGQRLTVSTLVIWSCASYLSICYNTSVNAQPITVTISSNQGTPRTIVPFPSLAPIRPVSFQWIECNRRPTHSHSFKSWMLMVYGVFTEEGHDTPILAGASCCLNVEDSFVQLFRFSPSISRDDPFSSLRNHDILCLSDDAQWLSSVDRAQPSSGAVVYHTPTGTSRHIDARSVRFHQPNPFETLVVLHARGVHKVSISTGYIVG